MKNRFLILPLLSAWMLAVVPLMANDVSVTAEANRGQIYLGESFILQLNVSGAGEAEPDLSRVKNCKVRNLGKQNISNYSISFVNGQVTRQGFSGLIITFEITPLAAGPFQAGPVSATVQGTRHTVEGPLVTVTDIEKQDLVKLTITSSSETVLIDEQFDVTLSVRIRRLAGKLSNVEPIFPDNPPTLTIPWLGVEGMPGLTGPDLNALLNGLLIRNRRPGFAINDYMRQPDLFDFSSLMSGGRRPALFSFDRRLTRENGQDYMEYYLTVSYSPKDEGNYVFGPVVFKGSVPVEVEAQGQARGMAIFAAGPACTVRVIPPPEEGRPASFTGAIGSNLTVKASLDATFCYIGDPLKLNLDLGGNIRFDKMLPPKLTLQTNLLEHFTIYDNTVQTVKQDGLCRYTYTLRPLHAGAFQVPPIEVSYYDVTSRKYKTVATPMIPLSVKRGSEVTSSQIMGNTNRLQAAEVITDDRTQPIAPPRMDADGAESVALMGNPVWLAVAGAGPGLFLIVLLIRYYRKHKTKRMALQRQRQAMPHAWWRLSNAIKAGSSDELCGAIRQYLGERLGVQSSGITPQDARGLLEKANVPAALARQLSAIFEHYFNAGFTTQTELANLSDDCRKLKKAIIEIEQAIRSQEKKAKSGRASGVLPLITGLLVLCSGLSAMALDKSERGFIWNEAQTCMATARTPADYLHAAQLYHQLVDDGVRNGPLFYNLGTALLRSGQVEPALEALQRAERFLGSQEDIRRNLKIAMARKADIETAEWPWYRLALSWHFSVPTAVRLMTTAGAFFIFWVMLTLRLAGVKHGITNVILVLAAITAILFGSSTAVTWHQEMIAPAAMLRHLTAGGKT